MRKLGPSPSIVTVISKSAQRRRRPRTLQSLHAFGSRNTGEMPLTKASTVRHLKVGSYPNQSEVNLPSRKSSDTVRTPGKDALSMRESKSGLMVVLETAIGSTPPKTTCGTRFFTSAVVMQRRKPNNSGEAGSSANFIEH